MENYEKIRNITFMGRKSVIKIGLLTLIFYLAINLVFRDNLLKLSLILKVYYLIGSITFIILLRPISKIYNEYIIKKIYTFICLATSIYVFAFIKNMSLLIRLDNYNIGMDIITNIIIFLEVFSTFVIIEYKCNRHKTNTKLYITLEILISLGLFIFYKELSLTGILIFMFLIELFFALRTFINQFKNNLIKCNYIENSNLYLTLVFLIPAINLLYMLGNYSSKTLLITRECLILIVFNVFWILFSTNLIKNPYKDLSESLIKKNQSLDELSKNILIKNKQLEKSIMDLKNREYLYETFFRFMPHPIIMISLKNDRILFANKAFLELLNTPDIREVINKKLSKYIYFVDSEEIKNSNFNAVLNAGNEDKFINAKFLSIYEDRMEDLIIIEDNTSKVLTEEIKREVENRIVEEKIREEFLSSISHDLKTPINVIYSATQVEKIYMDKKNIQALQKYNSISKRNCISLIRLTNNLIDSSKINSNFLMPSLERINVVETVEDVVTSLVDYAENNNTEIIFNTNTEESYLNLDYEFIQRIILNLISNSIKYTLDQGKINVNIHDDGKNVNISIIDNGIGMNKEFIKEAFCKYSMDKDAVYAKKGTGIGLFVVKKLVELQLGNIDIQTESGCGTNITIQFKKENIYE